MSNIPHVRRMVSIKKIDKCILIAEDDENLNAVVRAVASQFVIKQSCVRSYASGIATRDAFLDAPDIFMLVVLDVRLARKSVDLDGVVVAQSIKSKRADLPIIFFTNYDINAEPETRDKINKLGVFVSKREGVAALHEAMKAALSS